MNGISAKKYILENFDIPSLVECGFLEKGKEKDFEYIEARIVKFFDLQNIYEYSRMPPFFDEQPLKVENIFSEN